MSEKVELKPCRCGGMAIVVRHLWDNPATIKREECYTIECRCCQMDYKTEQEAIEAWNRRAQ